MFNFVNIFKTKEHSVGLPCSNLRFEKLTLSYLSLIFVGQNFYEVICPVRYQNLIVDGETGPSPVFQAVDYAPRAISSVLMSRASY